MNFITNMREQARAPTLPIPDRRVLYTQVKCTWVCFIGKLVASTRSREGRPRREAKPIILL